MFAAATKKFAEEVDRGLLIPVSSLNDTIDLLTVVMIKRGFFWFYQKPKFFPTNLHLNGLLTGDTTISPDTKESDFILDFQGTHHDSVDGKSEASYRNIKMGMKGENKSTVQSSFGRLKKEKANVEKLMKDSKGRMLDMSHCLIRQTKKKKKQQFGVVVERIRTTAPCSLTRKRQQAGHFEGKVAILDPLGSEASATGSGGVSRQSNVTMAIPINTTIAYSLMILEIEQDGSFGLSPICLLDRSLLADSNTSSLRQDLEESNDHFQLLSSLPVATKSSLLQHLTTIMEDQKAISALQDAMELMRQDGTPALPDVTITESQNQNIQAILELVEQADRSTSVLTALDLIISALEEMTSSCLDVLRTCCSPTVLQTLEKLLQEHILSGKGEFPLTALTGDVYEKAEQMFASCNVSLERDGDTVKTEMQREPEDLPLMLCIAIRGLASLGP